jgi:hypothetical protein
MPPTLPEFEKPPVVEVALSVQFDRLNASVAHLGLLWHRFRDRFGQVEEKPELPPAFERFGPAKRMPGVRFEVGAVPGLRLWFLDEKGSELIQVQRVSTATLQRSRPAAEAMLTDRLYRSRLDHGPQTAPQIPMMMETDWPLELPFGEGTFVFEPTPPDWVVPVLHEICRLGSLPANWNSYGAQPIQPAIAVEAIIFALNYLVQGDPLPSVVPTARGGILLEWHEGGVDLEVDIRSPSWFHVALEVEGNQEEFDHANVELIAEKLDVLRSRIG